MPLLLFHGDNQLEIDEAAKRVKGRFNSADVLTFEAAELALPALAEASLTAGLFDPERLVIVRGLHERLKGRKAEGEGEEIGRILRDVAPTTTLLLVSSGMAGDHQLVALVREAGGEVRGFQSPRRQDLAGWIMRRAQDRGTSLPFDAAELLADLVGAEPLLLDSELEKLGTYAGEGERITPSMVEELVGAIPRDSIFTLVDAIAAGNQGQALRLLHGQLERASTNPIDLALYLIRMLARQVRILLRIRLGEEAGRSRQEIIGELKIPRYYADRYFQQAKRLSGPRLRGAFEQLAALEHALKSGKADPATGLDLLVAELCA